MFKSGDMLSKLVYLKHITDLGAKHPEAGQFLGKTSYVNAIGLHFAGIQSHLEELDF